MPFTTISLGLTLTVPTNSTTNWGTQLQKQAWEPISSHDHTTGKGQQIPTGGIVDNAVTTAKIADSQVTSAKLATNVIADKQQATLTPGGTTQTIDWDNGNKAILDLSSATGAVTLTLNNPQTGGSYRIKVVQGGTVRSLVWPAAVLWPGGEEPSQFHEVNSDNTVYLDYDGTNYLGRWCLTYS